MRRYIVLLLITGLVWAQTDFDKLVLKNGTTYFGELVSYSTKTVIFVSGRVQYYRPISTVESLVLEDGTVLIREDKQLGLVGSTITAGVILVNIVFVRILLYMIKDNLQF